MVVEIQVILKVYSFNFFQFFIFIYEVFIKIQEIETQIMVISDLRVIVRCHSIHFILLSASLVC